MEINIEIFNKLVSLIEDSKKNKDYEFEARFMNKNKTIDEEKYNKIFQKFTFSKSNNGLGYKYKMKNILDVIIDKSSDYSDFNSLRLSINNNDDIKKYWLTNKIEDLDITFIEKEYIDKIDESNYNLRFSLKNEIPQNNILKKNIDLILSNEYSKVFRLKNRYSITTDDDLFTIDMTTVKMGKGKTFKESNTLKENINYEIEIEYIGKNINIEYEVIANKLLEHCYTILKLIQNSTIIISNVIVNNLKKNYNTLVNNKFNDYFIAASPVTIHRENLFKSSEIKNIYNRYAVTLKADGTRNFLIVHNSNKEEENGKIYIFNNNFQFMDTGYIDKSWVNTLIEAEYVEFEGEKELYMYDILFSSGIDVRKKNLMDIEKKGETRLDILDKFLKSPSRIFANNFNESNCIKLKNKKYIQSIRADGSDIFQKTKELWDTQKLSSFHVDGIIFVPKYEYYPLRGGSWYSLFKWKPPHLNTIDFLIEILKDDNKNYIKNPYIDVIERPDGKKETILKQYNRIKLYVSGQRKVYNNVNRKTNFKNIKVPFNPFGTDDKNSELYNLVNIFIEDDGKIYANDPLTNEKTEIYDDIIVEFGYNNSNEEGFKWVPYRFRKDKTNLYKSGKDMFGNNENIANDIFKSINNPITEEMITTGNIPVLTEISELNKDKYYQRSNSGERFPYQNFHNHYIKYQLLYFTSPSFINEYTTGMHGKILDLCCGRGVDLNKIKRAKYAEVVGMDIDYQNIKDAQEFYKTIVPSPKPKAYYVRGDSGKLIWPNQAAGITDADKLYIKKFIPSKYMFDTISLQFCLHYLFKDEISLRSIIQNMNDNLKIGGFVIGTTFDGERVYEKLKKVDFIGGKTYSGEYMWKIDKKYSSTKMSFTDNKPNFGKVIDVYIKTIGKSHPEYLVNFNYFDKLMNEYGFSKIVIKPFEDFHTELIEKKNLLDLTQKELEKDIDNAQKMSTEEKNFSFLSSGFIYKKESNSSDQLLKKLILLIEKKDKIKNKDSDVTAYKMDEDTSQLIIGED